MNFTELFSAPMKCFAHLSTLFLLYTKSKDIIFKMCILEVNYFVMLVTIFVIMRGTSLLARRNLYLCTGLRGVGHYAF